jgi:hypothetical protein
MEAALHIALVSSPHVLQPEWHGDEAICPDEVMNEVANRLLHPDLVITEVSVDEIEQL